MHNSDADFENEVRDIARHLWPTAAFSGSVKEGGRERDGVFITDEMVHLIECTTSRRKDKAEQDTRKLESLSRTMQRRYPTKGVKGYFITLEEPTAEQREAVRKFGHGYVVSLSFPQFSAQMVDARSYLDARMQYPFGSMYDPETQSRTSPSQLISRQLVTRSGDTSDVDEIPQKLHQGETLVLVGDYGAGKSTTLREIFVALRSDYFLKRTGRFPVHLNLRDHHGQTDPAEALERHARNIGFQSPNHLVRAWRAGYLILILDGFDEFATAGWSGQAKRLRDIRYNSMELIRHFMRGPSGTGVMVAGRQHYFDSEKELTTALGLSENSTRLHIDDFTDSQVREFLTKRGWEDRIPAWLPSRPLLLGYLCARDMLKEVINVDHGSSPAVGWNALLELTANREAEIEAGIDGTAVRRIVENLATKARSRNDGMGSLSQDDILGSFQSVCGFAPDDRGLLLLQRLPGLGAAQTEDGSRDFIDSDLVDAARGGDVCRFVEDPYSFKLESPANWQTTLGQLGIELGALWCHRHSFNEGKLRTALQQASRDDEQGELCFDLIQISREMGFGFSGQPFSVRNVLVKDASFGDLPLNYSAISFRDCLFQRLEMDVSAAISQLPRFYSCYVGTLDGRVSQMDLPKGIFDKNCVVDSFGESSQNTAAILALPLSTGAKVLLTVLKKLYLQPGAGRKESALFRGLDHRERALVPDVLDLLVKEGLTLRSTVGEEEVWLPTRSESVRVRRLVSSPLGSNDCLVQKANSIG